MADLEGVSISRVCLDHDGYVPPQPGDAAAPEHGRRAASLRPTGFGAPAAQAMAMILAGEAAGSLRWRRRPREGSSGGGDRRRAHVVARDLTGGDDVEAALLLDQQWRRTCERLDEPRLWGRVERIAASLLERRRLEGAALRALLE
jgi:hypothetical protein